MSTKLYNGIKFKSNKLGTVIQQLHSLKEESVKRVQDTFNDVNSANFITMVLLYMKCLRYGIKVENRLDFEKVLRDELRNPYSQFCFLYKFSVVIFERKNKLYGVYFDNTHKNYKELFDKDIAEDYHYQDQSDKPDDISNREWNFRKTVWNDIFDDISVLWIPSEAGVRYTIVDECDIDITEDTFKNIQDRIKKEKEKSDEQ